MKLYRLLVCKTLENASVACASKPVTEHCGQHKGGEYAMQRFWTRARHGGADEPHMMIV